MKKLLGVCLILLINISVVLAQKHKKHFRHTASATIKGAKIAGPIGAAGGFVIGRHFDKKKERKERKIRSK